MKSMSRADFNKLIVKKGFKEGDCVAFVHGNGWEEKAVLLDDIMAKVFFEQGIRKDKDRAKEWNIHFASLSGVTFTYFGEKVPFVDIKAWKPETSYGIECVRKIRGDLNKTPHQYIT